MSRREALRAEGAAIRTQLGIAEADDAALAPGVGNLVDEACFGRIWARSGLALTDRMLSTLAALTSCQYLPTLATYVESALHIGLPVAKIQEVMIHCAIYAGFSSAVHSLTVVHDVTRRLGVEVPERQLPDFDLDDFERLGEEVKRKLHGERAEKGYAAPEAAAAGLYETATHYGYGDIWNRPDLDYRERMICSIAAFTAISHESQARKFYRSALNVGLSREQIIEVIMQTAPYTGFPRALNGLVIAEEVLA